MKPQDHQHMARAIHLARRGLYTTHPNPRVGCVLVRGGEVVGEGYHRKAGAPHAERNALAAAGVRAKGATAYVTLEPCCHHGRTPPCTDGLIEAGVSRVVCAMVDPNPLVTGKGLALLRAAGIEAESGLLEAQARALNPGFIKRMSQGLPFVRCKLAMSLDGRTAMASGESKWITESAARRDVHRLRARSSAILTGIGTVLADDPSMDVRLDPADLDGVESREEVPTPIRAVLDSQLRFPLDTRMLTLPGRTLILCGEGCDEGKIENRERRGAQVIPVRLQEGRIDLPAALRRLAEEQINEVLLECGPVLAGAALQAGLIDELVIYAAPHLMGDSARGLFNLPAIATMAQRIDLTISDLRMVGRDIRITATPLAKKKDGQD